MSLVNPKYLGSLIEISFQVPNSSTTTDAATGNVVIGASTKKLSFHLTETTRQSDLNRIQQLTGRDNIRVALKGMYLSKPNNILPNWIRTADGIEGRCEFPKDSDRTGVIRIAAIIEGPFPAKHGTRILATFDPD